MQIFARKQKTAIKTLSQSTLHKFTIWIKQHEICHRGIELLFFFKMITLKPVALLNCVDPHEQLFAQCKGLFHCKAYKGLGMRFFIEVYKNFVHFHLVSLTTSTEVGLREQFMEALERDEENSVIPIRMIEPCIKLRGPVC